MEFILTLDKSLFYFINSFLSNSFFDWLMPIVTSQKNWNPIYIFLILFLIIKYKKNGLIISILLILSVGLTNLIGDEIKHLVGRLRPCRSLENLHLLVKCGPGKSFPSLHAANNFAMAVILSYFFRKNSWIFFSLASLVALSRVFVGVHFPVDIIAGAILGSLISIIFIKLSQKLNFSKIKNY
ncbi:MAG: hypothetical protein A2X64_11295 [Ignavibacteria bacterium GWF2_33_9]|nr:MAG: hypothetical protein A2X64_11295 [Ignavibacteria bacterium GWF2_33_9]